VTVPETVVENTVARGLLAAEDRAKPWQVIQGCHKWQQCRRGAEIAGKLRRSRDGYHSDFSVLRASFFCPLGVAPKCSEADQIERTQLTPRRSNVR
jgi:hypothetical protein